jgi:glycosyltransferase involved in cell wall biosynthesis
MHFGVVWEPTSAAYYRAIGPMQEMEKRGHSVSFPAGPEGEVDLQRLAGCDLVHVYRYSDADNLRLFAELDRGGIALTWDNDDDFINVPKEGPSYKFAGGLAGRRIFTQQLKTARLAQTTITPSGTLAERYRSAGIADVEVVENYLAPHFSRAYSPHLGIVIGWVAGYEHRADTARIGIAQALRQIMSEYDHVRVECIGVDLRLGEEGDERGRYRHDLLVPFEELPQRISGFDIGIAPLADIPFNHSRSNIKLKEYAASGIPWLASPVGPYAEMGVKQGGRLVPDGQWYEALRWMVVRERERQLLAENAKAWAEKQTMSDVARRWENIFVGAVNKRRAQLEATP